MKTARHALQALPTSYLSLSIVFGCMVLLAVSVQPIALYGQTYSDIHDFNHTVDGANPYFSGIVSQGRDGNMYGTTAVGVNNVYGGVYKITPSGTSTNIYNFTGGNDGTYPYGGLTLGNDGNFYGTTTLGGGTNGCYYGTVFKVTPSGTLTTLHCFTATNGDGYYPYSPPVLGKKGLYGVTSGYSDFVPTRPYTITSTGTYKLLPHLLPGPCVAPLLLASDGNFYGTTSMGGNSDYGTVFKLSAAGAVTIIHNFAYTDGGYPIGPLVQGSDGNLYGTTSQGGTAPVTPAGTAFKMTLKGKITVLKNFDYQSSDGASPYAGMVAGTDGNFYGATIQSSGAPYGTVFEITKAGTYSVVNAFDYYHGAYGYSSPMQHTNGIVYGEAQEGGANADGVFWKLDAGITPFASIVGFPAGSSGQTVEILGQGFNTATSVMFGSGSASFNIVSDTYLTATVPDSGTTGPVTVTTSGRTLTSKQTFRVIPVLGSFSPTSGGVGTPVTITGSGFTGTKTVTFGGVKATFTVVSGTQINTTVPTGAVTGKIKVTTPGGTATSKATFTVN